MWPRTDPNLVQAQVWARSRPQDTFSSLRVPVNETCQLPYFIAAQHAAPTHRHPAALPVRPRAALKWHGLPFIVLLSPHYIIFPGGVVNLSKSVRNRTRSGGME